MPTRTGTGGAALVSDLLGSMRSRTRARVLVAGVVLADLGLGLAASATDGNAAGAYLVLLLWPTLAAALVLPRLFVASQVGAVAATSLAVAPPLTGGALLQALAVTMSCGGAAFVVATMRERLTKERARLTETLQETRRLSHSDPFTGLVNRRGLEDRLPAMWNAATRRREALTVLRLEVDQLAAVGHQHGAAGAGTVLTELGAFLRSLVRVEDIVASFHGGHLVVVTADASTAGPSDIGERLRREVEQADMTHRVTVSVGAVRYLPSDLDDPLPTFASLHEDAEQAVDAAKSTGRNRVVGLSAPPVVIPPPRSATG